MNGQWIGHYSGINSGLLVIDCDDMETRYEDSAFAYDDNAALPGTFAFIRTPDKSGDWQYPATAARDDRQRAGQQNWSGAKVQGVAEAGEDAQKE